MKLFKEIKTNEDNTLSVGYEPETIKNWLAWENADSALIKLDNISGYFVNKRFIRSNKDNKLIELLIIPNFDYTITKSFFNISKNDFDKSQKKLKGTELINLIKSSEDKKETAN